MGRTARKLVVDPTIYRVEDDVGEHEIQTYILELLRPLIERYLAQREIRAHVGSDQYIYWVQYEPTSCVAPDVYLLPGVPQDIAIDVWKVWERNVVPSFALEVVGRDPKKDYQDSPKTYADLGVDELVIFDPFPAESRRAFQVYRRVRKNFRRVESTDSDRVYSKTLDCFIRAVGSGATLRLRLGTGPSGDELFPTGEEAARRGEEAARRGEEAARRGEEAALRGEEAARRGEEAARRGEEAALRRVAELEEALRHRDNSSARGSRKKPKRS